MKNLSRNTAAVLVLTLFTGLAVFSAIQLGGRLFGTSPASAQTVTSAEEYYDDGTSGGNGYGQNSGDSSQGYVDPYGQGSGTTDPYGSGDSSGSGSTSGTTMTCPATGCSASTCHALQ
jgi:hypothetical protein